MVDWSLRVVCRRAASGLGGNREAYTTSSKAKHITEIGRIGAASISKKWHFGLTVLRADLHKYAP